MKKIIIDFNKETGKIKPMNAVNNGPLPITEEMTWSNFSDYKKACFPYARTHDASFCARYGGEHSVDTAFIFRDFDADADDPASYDFQLTDEYLNVMISAGTEPFFRLGSKIEHWSKKYNTIPPKDYRKWAEICEHIIAHYTEGWANGFTHKITYWEIWNEADGRQDEEPPEKKECWGGTRAQFYEFFAIVAKHLKKRFPHLKIGGPAVCSVDMMKGAFHVVKPWVDDFLKYMRDNDVPLDFFSWHGYTNRANNYVIPAIVARKTLDKYGFCSTESILNEWNYLIDWFDDDFLNTILGITGIKGAAFAAAVMTNGQNTPVDMLMYYDARPSTFNGLFDYYTQKPLKTYHVFSAFAEMRRLGTQVFSTSKANGVYVLAAKGEGKKVFMISYYPSPVVKKPKEKKIKLFCDGKKCELKLLDEKNDFSSQGEKSFKNGRLTLSVAPYSVIFAEIKE